MGRSGSFPNYKCYSANGDCLLSYRKNRFCNGVIDGFINWISPYAVFGPAIGVLIDRNDRKKIMIGADLIIAANSTVVKNIEPYTINGGNPAKFIKKRFSDEKVEFLLIPVSL